MGSRNSQKMFSFVDVSDLGRFRVRYVVGEKSSNRFCHREEDDSFAFGVQVILFLFIYSFFLVFVKSKNRPLVLNLNL